MSFVEVNLIQRPDCCCPILWRRRFGSLSNAPLKNASAHVSLSGTTIATFFFSRTKHGLPHFTSSPSPHPSAITLNASTSFSHLLAYGTFIGVPSHHPLGRRRNCS